ncbi:hypothetical protein LTQ56_17685 [Mycobacterium intracellulare subsp. intracellulare]|uniref:P-loop ATPase, Sll1717 family n=1 Tax=Mycobacterium intracellulare TaxID=1767 RepID=UPI0012F4EAC5|nr:hypothetical protein [Mycobacterium intracellulare]UGU05767.1 hypothetical protein LTQ56_17685 [Mycobacterium intracellulare subsp. intracellulare]BCO59623.1 hypothetical protein MINTM005_48670 [Mycobacterium intracellulare]BCO96803.1 hypothetical protein MINTM016_47790 [Mycobacterium intracellulare]
MTDRGITYFGEPDASIVDISSLGKQHVQRGIESKIKHGNKTEGLLAIVGVKGSGKTDLRKHIENAGPAYVFNLNAERYTLTIDASVKDTSGRIKTVVSMLLLRGFAKQVGADGNSAPKKALLKVLETSTKILENLPESVELGFSGFGKLSLGKLLKTDATEWVQNAIDSLISGVVPALENKRGYILIDDVEDVFPGIAENPIFLEGVVRSIKDINVKTGDRLHVLIFIKHGLWKSWSENNRREYDKVRSVIGHLQWDREALVALIARRIATRQGIDPDSGVSVEDLWSMEFDFGRDFESFTHKITAYCVNGPRDMIELCNLAAIAAAGERITWDDFAHCIGDFSDDKFFGLNEDYGDMYPGITSFVERVFRELNAFNLKGTELSEYIEATTLADPDAEKEAFYKEKWFTERPRQRLAVLLYEIGIVGFGVDPNITYAIEMPTISQSDLMAQKNIVVHPAFRPHLEIAR